MAITKQKKAEIESTLRDILKETETLVFVKFDHLTVGDASELRRSLRAEGVGYKVAKKTLIKRALAEKGYTGELPELEGEIGIAYGSDEIAPARGVYEFQKTHKEQVSIVGGVFGGSFVGQERMMSIATIPSRDVLLSQIAFLLKSPMQRLAIAVSEVAKTKSA